MGKIKFAIIGCGNIGTRHAAAIKAEPRAVLGAVCDINEAKCTEFSRQNGNIPHFTDYKRMLREADIDIVSICTPNGLHAEMAMETAKMKKNILVEKPMALTANEAKKMIAAANKNKVKLMVVKQNRFNAPVALAQKAVSEGRLGQIFMVNGSVLWHRDDEYYSRSDWRGKKKLEGGALYTQASHFVDLLIWWCGKVKSARALTDTKNHAVEIEDCGAAVLEFQKGAIGALEWTTCVRGKNYEGSITIIGEKGTIKIGGPYLNKIEFWDIESYPLPDNAPLEENNFYDRQNGKASSHNKVIENAVAALLGEKCSIISGEEGLKTVEAIEKIYASARRKK